MNIPKITEQNFPEIYAAYRVRVRKAIYYAGIPKADIDDVAQDAWLTAWRYREKYNPKYPLTTFIMLQAQAAASWYRRRASSQIHFIGHPVPVADDWEFEDDRQMNEFPAYVPSNDDRGWSWQDAGKIPGIDDPPDIRKHPANCKHGHPMTPENTYRYPSGNRRCRACQEKRERARRVLKKSLNNY